jgi:hypothetical protein
MDVAKGVAEPSIDISALAKNLDLNLTWEKVEDASVCTNPLRFINPDELPKKLKVFKDCSENALVNLYPIDLALLYQEISDKVGHRLEFGQVKDIFHASIENTAFARNVASRYSVYGGELVVNGGKNIHVRRMLSVSHNRYGYDRLVCKDGMTKRYELNDEIVGNVVRKVGRDCIASTVKQKGTITEGGYFTDIHDIFPNKKDLIGQKDADDLVETRFMGYFSGLPNSSKFPSHATIYGTECHLNPLYGTVHISCFSFFTVGPLKSMTAAAPWTYDD